MKLILVLPLLFSLALLNPAIAASADEEQGANPIGADAAHDSDPGDKDSTITDDDIGELDEDEFEVDDLAEGEEEAQDIEDNQSGTQGE